MGVGVYIFRALGGGNPYEEPQKQKRVFVQFAFFSFSQGIF